MIDTQDPNELNVVSEAPLSEVAFPEAIKSNGKTEDSEAEFLRETISKLEKKIQLQEKDKHEALEELKDRYRSVSNNMKNQYDRMKSRLQLAVNKGREVVLRNQELERQLQQSQAEKVQLMNNNSELNEMLDQQKETLHNQYLKNIENLKRKLLEVSNEKKFQEEAIDQILKQQSLSQNISVTVNGPCLNSVPLQAVVENYDQPVDFQWYRAAHAKYVPIPGSDKSSYTPTADDIGTMLRITCTTVSSNIKCSREVGPIQIEPKIEQNLHACLQKLKQTGPFFEQKVLQENNEPLYIRITCDKVKIRNEKMTLEKEEFNEHLMITLSDEDPLKFTLRISASSKHRVHQFKVGKVTQREIVTLLLRTMYMRSLTTKMDNRRQAVRCLVLASSLKARLVLDPYASNVDNDSNNKILKALQNLTSNSSMQINEPDSLKLRLGHRRERSNGQDSVQTLNSMQTTEIFQMTGKSSRPLDSSSGFGLGLETPPVATEHGFLFDMNSTPLPSSTQRASSIQDFESENDTSSVDTRKSKAIEGLTILDASVVLKPTDDAFQTFQICPPSQQKPKKKTTKKRKRKTRIQPSVTESWTLKINDRQLTERRCTGEIKLCFNPPPRKEQRCGLLLNQINHLERINCNPEFVEKKDAQENSYDVRVDEEISELVAMKYTVVQALLERLVPLKAQALWEIQEKETKITLRWKMNPANRLPLANVTFEVQLSHPNARLKQTTCSDPSINLDCTLENYRLRLIVQQPLPPNLEHTIELFVLLSTQEKLAANPFNLTFQSSGHFTPEFQMTLIEPESGSRWILEDQVRTSMVSLEIF